MLVIALALVVAAAAWTLWSVQRERSARISDRELRTLAATARRSGALAQALAHRQAVLIAHGDPDGSDPMLEQVDRLVRQVSLHADAVVSLRSRRQRVEARQAIVDGSRGKSAEGSRLVEQAIDDEARHLADTVARLASEADATQRELDAELSSLRSLRELAEARVEARLRPRRTSRPVPRPAPRPRLQAAAAAAADALREVTSPRAHLVPASGSGAPVSLPPLVEPVAPAPRAEEVSLDAIPRARLVTAGTAPAAREAQLPIHRTPPVEPTAYLERPSTSGIRLGQVKTSSKLRPIVDDDA